MNKEDLEIKVKRMLVNQPRVFTVEVVEVTPDSTKLNLLAHVLCDSLEEARAAEKRMPTPPNAVSMVCIYAMQPGNEMRCIMLQSKKG